MPPKPSEPVRPTPAIGQVWRTRAGIIFVISRARFTTGSQFATTYENGDCISCCETAAQCVLETDTYLGTFAGFMIEENGE